MSAIDGVVEQERAVGLVGLDHEQLAVAGAASCARAPAITPPLTKLGSAPSSRSAVTIMPVEVVLPWAPATETSRRRADQPVQRLRAVEHRQPALEREPELGVVRPERAGVDDACRHRRDSRRRARSRSGARARAARCTASRCRAVGPGDADAGVEEHPRDAAHARAADADEVRGAELRGEASAEVGLDHPESRYLVVRRRRASARLEHEIRPSGRLPSRVPTVAIARRHVGDQRAVLEQRHERGLDPVAA